MPSRRSVGDAFSNISNFLNQLALLQARHGLDKERDQSRHDFDTELTQTQFKNNLFTDVGQAGITPQERERRIGLAQEQGIGGLDQFLPSDTEKATSIFSGFGDVDSPGLLPGPEELTSQLQAGNVNTLPRTGLGQMQRPEGMLASRPVETNPATEVSRGMSLIDSLQGGMIADEERGVDQAVDQSRRTNLEEISDFPRVDEDGNIFRQPTRVGDILDEQIPVPNPASIITPSLMSVPGTDPAGGDTPGTLVLDRYDPTDPVRFIAAPMPQALQMETADTTEVALALVDIVDSIKDGAVEEMIFGLGPIGGRVSRLVQLADDDPKVARFLRSLDSFERTLARAEIGAAQTRSEMTNIRRMAPSANVEINTLRTRLDESLVQALGALNKMRTTYNLNPISVEHLRFMQLERREAAGVQ